MRPIPRTIIALVAAWLAGQGYSLLTAPPTLISVAIAAIEQGGK